MSKTLFSFEEEYPYNYELGEDLPIVNYNAVTELKDRFAVRSSDSIKPGYRFRLVKDNQTAIATVVEFKHNLAFIEIDEWQSVVEVKLEKASSDTFRAFEGPYNYFNRMTEEQFEEYTEERSKSPVACACMGCSSNRNCRICNCQHWSIAEQARHLNLSLEETIRQTYEGKLGWRYE